MASAKKRRGRERKAAKKNNSGGGRTISTDVGVVVGGIDIDSSTDCAVLVEGVRAGNDSSTSHAVGWYVTQVHDRQNLIRAGLLDITLGYLKRCNENFGSVVSDIGGDLVSPISWADLLVTIATKSNEYHSQIIDNIGPLADACVMMLRENSLVENDIGMQQLSHLLRSLKDCLIWNATSYSCLSIRGYLRCLFRVGSGNPIDLILSMSSILLYLHLISDDLWNITMISHLK